MPKFIDLTGRRIGMLTVLERDGSASNGNARWKCICDCGNMTTVNGDILRGNKIKSCGCALSKDFTGRRFGKLKVLKRISAKDSESGLTEYQCLCDCGNTIVARSSNLSSGNTTSCGCYHFQRLQEYSFVDLSNIRFGRLVAQYPIRKKNGSLYKWHCKCDCGNEVDVFAGNLTKGNSLSCGCLQLSHGAYKIKQLLIDNHITFKQEYTFKGLVGDKRRRLRYDFAIFQNDVLQYLIEFDGQQHYEPKEHYGGLAEFKKRQLYDNQKNQAALEKSIPLIRIPYYHEKSICLNDLLLETSDFIVTEQKLVSGG